MRNWVVLKMGHVLGVGALGEVSFMVRRWREGVYLMICLSPPCANRSWCSLSFGGVECSLARTEMVYL
jgi:hypothetical protein